MSIKVSIEVDPVNVDGEDCITVNDYARIVGKSVQIVYLWVKEEKIRGIDKLGKILIPISELPKEEKSE